MLKRLEVSEPNSCLNRAREEEPIFVLLGRDPAAPAAIRAWCMERLKAGRNSGGDAQISEALELAEAMEKISAPRGPGRAL